MDIQERVNQGGIIVLANGEYVLRNPVYIQDNTVEICGSSGAYINYSQLSDITIKNNIVRIT